MRSGVSFGTVLTALLIASGAATVVLATTSCFVDKLATCCNLMVNPPQTTLKCPDGTNCHDEPLTDSDEAHWRDALSGEAGRRALHPTGSCPCKYQRRICNTAGNCVDNGPPVDGTQRRELGSTAGTRNRWFSPCFQSASRTTDRKLARRTIEVITHAKSSDCGVFCLAEFTALDGTGLPRAVDSSSDPCIG